jgi:hypothetical protein
MFQALVPLLKQCGKVAVPIAKKVGPMIIKAFKNKQVQEATIAVVSTAAGAALEKKLNDKNLSIKQKLKLEI